MSTVHLLIKGKVQGVYYRATAKDVAETLDLSGWIKNTPGGDVEAISSGSEMAVQQFIEWCKRGPDNAIVSSVTTTTLSEKTFEGFRIVRG